ncbi:MAG TPA: hypothetical protein VMU36_03860 [Spirochaetia bacterium]|nr:hypothetical protein [Spirochaetia bacterium]
MAERIGDILLRIGAITQEQVNDVLSRQAAGDGRMFGEIAIEQAYIDDAALKRYVEYKAAQTGG